VLEQPQEILQQMCAALEASLATLTLTLTLNLTLIGAQGFAYQWITWCDYAESIGLATGTF